MLKRYTDYTTKELANVTEEELQRLIEIECMKEGVSSFITPPKYINIPEVPEPDMVVYEVGNFRFSDEEEANKLVELLKTFKSHCELDYEYGFGYEKRYVKPIKYSRNIEERLAYSKESYDAAKYAIRERDKIKEKNETMKNKYNQEKEPYDEIKGIVMDAYQEALYEEEKYEIAKSVYLKYLSLSNNDVEVAENFFKGTSYSEYLERIREELKDGTHTEL